MLAATVVIIGELIRRDGTLKSIKDEHENLYTRDLINFDHIAMCAMTTLAAVVEILRFYSILFLPSSTEHILTSLAFSVIGNLFYPHFQERSELNQKVHMLICVVAFSITMVIILEAWQPKSVILFKARTILVVLLGTWFIQVAHVLHGTHPWKDTPYDRAFVAIAFSWHILGLLLTFLCSLVVVSVFVRLRRSGDFKCLPTDRVQKGGLHNSRLSNKPTVSFVLTIWRLAYPLQCCPAVINIRA